MLIRLKYRNETWSFGLHSISKFTTMTLKIKKKSNKRMMRIVMIIIEMEITLWSLQNINVTNWYNTFPSFRLVRDNYFEQFFFKYTANEQREWTRTRTNVCRIWCTVGNHRLSIATINYIVFSIECKYFLL